MTQHTAQSTESKTSQHTALHLRLEPRQQLVQQRQLARVEGCGTVESDGRSDNKAQNKQVLRDNVFAFCFLGKTVKKCR
jgi:hypothetical protein